MRPAQPFVNGFDSKLKLIRIDSGAKSAFLNPCEYVENYSVFSGKNA